MTALAQRKPRLTVQQRKLAEAIKAAYDAGGMGRRIAKWNPQNSGPRTAQRLAQRVVSRTRDAVRNDWAARSSVIRWVSTLVGVGITPRWDDQAITDLWAQWGQVADANGVLDVYGLQALAVRAWIADGEVFVRRRVRSLTLRLPVPMQIQVIESDYCPRFSASEWQGMPAGNRIVDGIELNAFDDRVAYWMFKSHPGDPNQNGTMPSNTDLVRVPASQVIHMYEPERPGDMRGMPSLATVLPRIRATGNFEDAVLDRQQLANMFTMFITRQLPQDWRSLDIDPTTGLPRIWGTDGVPLATMEPGMSQELRPGEDVKFASPPGPGVGFAEYLRSTHLGTAAGQGMPYELMTGDIANISDRTIRVIIQEFRRHAEQRQWHVIIPQLCRKVVSWFGVSAILGGMLPREKQKAVEAAEHVPHGFDYIHPVQDVQGKILAIEAGLTSRTREINKRGDDPATIDKERKADQDREEKLGINPPPDATPPGKQQRQPQALDLSPILAMMASLQTMLANVQAMGIQAAAPAAQPLPAPNVTAHIHMPPGAAPIVNVEPTPVHVDVTPTPVQVNNAIDVAPTPVQISNVVDVAPTPVQITNEVQPAEVTVNLPDRRTDTTVVRDTLGNIVSATQVERNLQ